MKVSVEFDLSVTGSLGHTYNVLNEILKHYNLKLESRGADRKVNTPKIGTVTVVEAPKKVTEWVDLPKEEKVAEEPEKAPVKKRATKPKVTITLEELKDLAAERAKVSGRDKTRAIIGEYGEKLSEVKSEDYEALAEKLKV